MSERLIERIEKHLISGGKNARVKLCADAEISLSTLDNVLGNRTNSQSHSANTLFRLAKACGCDEQEALELAKCAPAKAKVG